MSSRLLIALAGAAVILAAATGLYWKGRIEGAAQERPRLEAAESRAALSGLETRGERQTAQRVEVVVRQREALEREIAELSHEALKAEDADAPLDPQRAARLLAADRELCLAAGDLAGCAPAGDAGAGPTSLRTVPTADEPDPS